jgi:hypothetical protein
MTEEEAKEYARRNPCLRSGFCCKRAPCTFGSWDTTRKQCAKLVVERVLPNGAEVHACGIYDEIIARVGLEGSPGFGGGCGSTLFNDLRERVREGLRQEVSETEV